MPKKINFTNHAANRIRERNLDLENVEHVIRTGTRSAAPGGCLNILGVTKTGRFLKAVVSITDRLINVITVYPAGKERMV